jgi:hypothetical protein
MNLFGRVSQNTDMPKTHNGRFEKPFSDSVDVVID